MPDTALHDTKERLTKIRTFIANLDARFNELLWNNPTRVAKLERFKPTLIAEFWTRYAELDVRCSDYLEGKIDWARDSLQMQFTPLANAPYPVLEIDRDVENYGRDLFCWLVLQLKDL